jgi:hypothetical protein
MVARRWQHLPHHVEDADMSRKLLLTTVASVSEGERLEALARATAAEIERMTAEEQAKVTERCAYLLPKDGSPDQAIDLPKAIELQRTIDAKFDVVPVVAPVDQAISPSWTFTVILTVPFAPNFAPTGGKTPVRL